MTGCTPLERSDYQRPRNNLSGATEKDHTPMDQKLIASQWKTNWWLESTHRISEMFCRWPGPHFFVFTDIKADRIWHVQGTDRMQGPWHLLQSRSLLSGCAQLQWIWNYKCWSKYNENKAIENVIVPSGTVISPVPTDLRTPTSNLTCITQKQKFQTEFKRAESTG